MLRLKRSTKMKVLVWYPYLDDVFSRFIIGVYDNDNDVFIVRRFLQHKYEHVIGIDTSDDAFEIEEFQVNDQMGSINFCLPGAD